VREYRSYQATGHQRIFLDRRIWRFRAPDFTDWNKLLKSHAAQRE
jgi:hypothetical protein